jgi:hypothetical protein
MSSLTGLFMISVNDCADIDRLSHTHIAPDWTAMGDHQPTIRSLRVHIGTGGCKI